MTVAVAALYDADGRLIGRHGLPFTDEQAVAITRRTGPLLLSANAGSGKTSVLSERFVRSVLEDELEPGRILAITFTDKAAGELRARVRARFVELGRRDRARDLESAWISTFHGLCARILRAHAVRAGLDPAFRVLEESEARDARTVAFEVALAGFLAAERPEALDLVAAYGVDALQGMVTRTHDQLRSAGQTRPSLPVVTAPADADPAALTTALERVRAELDPADERRGVVAARGALQRCAALLAAAADAASPPSLGALEGAAFKPGNLKVLKTDACAAYLDALTEYATAVRDALAARAVALLDELLGRHADAYAQAKRARAALDFDDLELLARDLLRAAPTVRAAYAERFERVMVDEFQDTNAVQLELLELLSGDRFLVGDELQSIYGFRHADVGIFRAQRAALSAHGAAAELATNFRSRPEILGVLDDALGPLHGEAHVPFIAGRDAADLGGGGARVELLLTDAAAVESWPPETLASLPSAPDKRRAEARVVAARVAALIRDEGVAPSEVVLLLRAATDIAVFERALEEQGLSTLAAGGRGYWGRQQVLDLCAYLGALANPRDELALFGLLASPLVGLSADGLAIVARAARPGERWDALAATFCSRASAAMADGRPDAGPSSPLLEGQPEDDRAAGPSPLLVDGLPDADYDALANFCPWFLAERVGAPRRGLDELLERVVDHTGYDLHVLGLAGGRRRWANVLKLQRLAAAFEARRGRDLRGLIDLATAELEAEARETDAPVELGDASAVRLMTMHAAKGLEFPVVVVADLGREGRIPNDDLLVDGDRIGLRLRTVDGGRANTLHYEALREERARAEAEEERRILHVAMTRAEERLLISGALDADKLLGEPLTAVAPIRWLAPRLVGGLAALIEQAAGDGTPQAADPDPSAHTPRVVVTVHRQPPPTAPDPAVPVAAEAPGPGHIDPPAPPGGQMTFDLFGPPAPVDEGTLDGPSAPADPLAGGGPSTAPEPSAPVAPEVPPRVLPAVRAVAPRPLPAALSYSSLAEYDRCAYRWYLQRVLRLPREDPGPLGAAAARTGDAETHEGLDPLVRGSLVHRLLEDLDFAAPTAVPDDVVRAIAEYHELELTDAEVADLQQLVAAFASSPLRARLAAAPDVRREHGFVVGLGDEHAPLLNGFIDVLAFEDAGGALIVDYKSDPVAPDADLEAYVEADYGAQRRIYALAALGAGAPDVEVAHLFLVRPDEPAVAIYDQTDVPRLRADLERRIAGIAAGRFVPTVHPHRTLCATCPGRRALCHHPEELTLRESPEPAV